MIEQILTQIHCQKQKMFGTHLKQPVLDLEQQLFSGQKISEAEMRLVIFGNESMDGLLSLCDNRENVTNKLKKSSKEAFRLIYRLITESQQKKDYLEMLQEFDSEEFKLLNLSIHITKNTETNIGLKFASIIKKQRKYLEISAFIILETFISSEKAQQIFIDYEDELINNIQNRVSLCETSERQSERQSEIFERTSFNTKKVKLKKQFGIFITRDLKYYTETFYDPLQLILDEQKQQKLNKKNKKNKKSQLFQIKCEQLPLTNFMENQDIPEMIERIHIESPKFDPQILINVFHQKTSVIFIFLLISSKKNQAVF